jgi:hypothetical protein
MVSIGIILGNNVLFKGIQGLNEIQEHRTKSRIPEIRCPLDLQWASHQAISPERKKVEKIRALSKK